MCEGLQDAILTVDEKFIIFLSEPARKFAFMTGEPACRRQATEIQEMPRHFLYFKYGFEKRDSQ